MGDGELRAEVSPLTGIGFQQRNEYLIPYLFSSPDTNGHGSLAAAVGAIIAELEPGKLYEYEGSDHTAAELAKQLLLIVAAQEVSGAEAPPIRFSRSHSRGPGDEFVIMKRDEAAADVDAENSVGEAWPAEERRSGVEDRRTGDTGRQDRTSQQNPAQRLLDA